MNNLKLFLERILEETKAEKIYWKDTDWDSYKASVQNPAYPKAEYIVEVSLNPTYYDNYYIFTFHQASWVISNGDESYDAVEELYDFLELQKSERRLRFDRKAREDANKFMGYYLNPELVDEDYE